MPLPYEFVMRSWILFAAAGVVCLVAAAPAGEAIATANSPLPVLPRPRETLFSSTTAAIAAIGNDFRWRGETRGPDRRSIPPLKVKNPFLPD
jgi:hypothetical protein